MGYYKDIVLWSTMLLKNKIISKLGVDFTKYYFIKNQLLDSEQASHYIMELLLSDKPCMIARFGASEMNVVSKVQKMRLKLSDSIPENAINQLCNWSGFFPNSQEAVMRFSDLTIDATKQLDLLGVWNVSSEEYTVGKYNSNAKLTKLENLEPWYLPEHAWSSALKGKKVLIIHPFTDTIQRQYQKRESLFPGLNILPEFTLLTLKAVQTLAGEGDIRFKTWFEAYDFMYEEAMKFDFDIVILGCGAYGFPLAYRFKMAGKKAIHLGGATQLLFGIKGKRWDEIPFFQKLYNSNWIRPSDIEKPKNAASVENGCYW